MCDLIDLNSPDMRKLLDPTKLASPLIPVPKNEESNNETNSSVAGKCDNEGNNPFDQVLHETAEYISKKGDPFEVMLQRALNSRSRRCTDLKAQSVDFMDDFTPRRKKRYLKTMNKTLDVLEGSVFEESGLFNGHKKVKIEKEIHVDLEKKNTDVCDNATQNASEHNCTILVTSSDVFESSILNKSAMNDMLLEGVSKSVEDSVISSLPDKDAVKTFLIPSNINFNSLDHQRSLSQGAEKSPLRLLCPYKRSQSLTNDHQVSQNDDNTMSFLNKGFLERKQSEQSVFSTLSNVSSITKLTSASMSSVLSNDNMNHAFLDSDSLKVSHEKINTPENSLEIKPRLYDLSDLAEKLKKLRCTINRTSISSITEDESNVVREENDEQITNDKLIDVDVFVPEQNFNKMFNKSSSSASSSDSVFNNTGKIDKSVLNEARMLAKTFEEFALKTDSGSSMDDDLISNNTLWMSELLPAFEDEPVIDNLIELPFSSEENLEDARDNDEIQSSPNIDNAEEISLKKIDSPFTDCLPAAKQIVLTSLLSDLRKLVKVENPEASKLLDNLESALHFNKKNNTELLEMCLNMSNELQKPQKVLSDIVENVEHTSGDRNENDDRKEYKEVSSKENICNNEKSFTSINHKFENTSQATTVNTDNSSIKYYENYNENDLNTKNLSNGTLDIAHAKEKDSQSEEKIAMELLVNLGKLLNGQSDDDMIKQLLKNIGKALSVASNNYKDENEVRTDYDKMRDIQQTTPVKATRSNRNAFVSSTAHRRIFESKSNPHEKSARRSISAADSSPKSTSSTQIRDRRSASKSEDRRKRFSSDPGFSSMGNKKVTIPEASNVRKVGIAKHDTQKENPIAMSDVKNKLKKRSDTVNKRGPMKAVHPVDNMQKKRVSVGRQTIPSSKTTTPPKSDKTIPFGNKIISSTPNSVDNNYYVPKKPVKSKPMASSTPDGQNNKPSSAHLTSTNKKHNFSCDISPVTMHVNTSSNNELKDSPKKPSKLPTPKKCTTPKNQQTNACGIPRYTTPPKHNLSFNMNYQQSPQRSNKSLVDCQRYSPISQKKSAEKIRQSPLKENNRITVKVKPLNLISKIKHHSASDFTEKENYA